MRFILLFVKDTDDDELDDEEDDDDFVFGGVSVNVLFGDKDLDDDADDVEWLMLLLLL